MITARLLRAARPSVYCLRPGRHIRWSSSIDELTGRSVQSYVSSSSDPFLNLSIEHHLLQQTPADSVVLLFYVNRPCVVIGRNQNPWVEVNHSFVRQNTQETAIKTAQDSSSVDLVRRRSGGGTVFHDAGNVNWTVISPASSFTRDKHAEMVVRALRRCRVARSRVNERHDIVLDQGRLQEDPRWGPDDDRHDTPWRQTNPVKRGALKVSGSAYKLTRGRALHHGTALLDSLHLDLIPRVLTSPARDFIKGRGVDSVSSPVGNIKLPNETFIEAVQREFAAMYDDDHGGDQTVSVVVDDGWLALEGVRKGYEEIISPAWTYLQTPQFTISNERVDAAKVGSSLTAPLWPTLSLNVKHGRIADATVSDCEQMEGATSLGHVLRGLAVHEITDWNALFCRAGLRAEAACALVHWLENVLGTGRAGDRQA